MAKGKGFFRTVALMFDRNAAKRMEEEAAESLARAGKDGSEELAQALEQGGKVAARALAKSLRDEYNNTIAAGRLDLAKGVIDPEQFAAIEREAARTFNQQLIPMMEKLRAEGKLTDAEFATLARRVKRVGDEGEKDLTILERALGRVKAAATGVGATLLAIFAVNRIRQFGQAAVQAALDAREGAQRVLAVWRANAGAVGRTFEELMAFASRMKWATLFGEDAIQRAIAQLLTYKSIAGDTFERTIRLGGDMASVFGGLEQSVAALARALDDPIAGLGQLRKAGYTFEDSVIAQIKALTQQGELFAAQRIILRELEKEVGGVAAGMKTGWVRVVDDARKAWADLKIEIGETMLEAGGGTSVMDTIIASVKTLTSWMVDNREEIRSFLRSIIEGLQEVAARITSMVKAIMVGGAVAALTRFRAGILAANAAAITFRATLQGFYALLGPKGWIILGVAALTEVMHRSGQAAKEAKERVSDYLASLKTMTVEELSAEIIALGQQRRNIEEQISRATGPRKKALERNLELVRQAGLEAIRLRSELMRASGAEPAPTGGGTPDKDAQNQALREEINLLKQASTLRLFGARESLRATALEQSLRADLARGNLTLDDRVRIQGHLNDLEAIRKAEAGRAVADAREELGLLERTSRVRRLSAEETARARELEADLRQALTQTTLTRAEQLDIEDEILKARGLLRTAVDDETSALREAAALRALTAEEQARALILEDQIAAQLAAATDDLGEQNRLQAQLNTLRGLALAPIEREVSLLGDAARHRKLSRDEVERLRIREAELRAQLALAESLEEEVRLRSVLADIEDILSDIPSLAGAMEAGLTNAVTNSAGAFQGFFSALATGFDATEAGFHSVADAAAGIGGAMVAGLAEGMAQYHLAQAAGKLAEGIWPPNPVALAAAGKHSAAAGLFKALGAYSARAGQSPGGLPTAPGGVGLRAGQEAARHGPQVHVYIDPLDPSNPAYQRNVYAANSYATGRFGEDAQVIVHPRTKG